MGVSRFCNSGCARAGYGRPSVGGDDMRRFAIVLGMTLACAGRQEASHGTEAKVTARGEFEVKVTPQPADDSAAGPFGRLFIDKRFHGDLQGTSKGQMLAANTAVEGSGAHVAFELVSGTLKGKT